jgi:DNA-binding MarR family transcriptional regulator
VDEDATQIAELSAALRTAIGVTYRRFRSERGPGELGDGALAVLTRISKRGPQTLTELSEDARVRPSSMSQVLSRLRAGGYVRRGPDPADGRRVLIALTAEGEAVAQETIAVRERWFASHLEALPATDRAALARAAAILTEIARS